MVLSEEIGYGEAGPGGSIVLNSTAEFCRTLGDIPTYGLAGNRDEDAQEMMVVIHLLTINFLKQFILV